MICSARDWPNARIQDPSAADHWSPCVLATNLSSRRHFFLLFQTHHRFPPSSIETYNTITALLGKSRFLVKFCFLSDHINPLREACAGSVPPLEDSASDPLDPSDTTCDSARSRNSCSLGRSSSPVALEHYRSPSIDSFKLAGLRYTQYSSLLHPLAGPKFRVFCGGDTRPP